ncbi:MAG: hypothetical protein WD267_03175 [Balneolales bacterium]
MSFITLFILSAPHLLQAQVNPNYYSYPNNHLDWYTIESEHFMIHFQEGNSRPAQVISRISEEIYTPITDLYDHYPDQKVSIVLNDREDYSNGAAYFYDNKIEIWLPALGTPLRGTHSWLRNVITHEFTHMVQIQAAMKRSRRHPATYLQWLSYEDVRRPDVLYGFPTGFISYPFAGISMPGWLAEGTAQYMRQGIDYDDWDSMRDMILRTRILDNSQLSLESMGSFASKTSIEREVLYNQGFAFTRYIAETYGEQSLADVTRAISQSGVHDVSEAIEIGTGLNGKDVYKNWIAQLKAGYQDRMQDIVLTNSTKIEDQGYFNFYPAFSPDGVKAAYLSNQGRDDSRVGLFFKDLQTGKTEKAPLEANLFPGLHPEFAHEHKRGITCNLGPDIRLIRSAFSYSPDGDRIAFSRNRRSKYGEGYNDLYVYDIENEEDQRLTTGKRIHEPAWSPDGNTLAAGMFHDGSMNLVTYDFESKEIIQLTDFQNGEQIYRPVWHPDGEQIYYAFSDSSHRSIYRYDLITNRSSLVIGNEITDFRDPHIDANGNDLYFSADVDGIFNIYKMNLTSGRIDKMTEVTGGAFMPAVNEDGMILFAEYVTDGYKISLSEPSDLLSQDVTASLTVSNTMQSSEPINNPLNNFDDSDITSFDDMTYAHANTGSYNFSINTRGQNSDRQFRRYSDEFISFGFYPVLRFDNYTKLKGSNNSLLRNGQFGSLGQNLWRDSKIGFYLSSRDVLERLTFFGGFMVGPGSRETESIGGFFSPARLVSLDRDAFLIVEYAGLPFIKRFWSPTVSLSVFNIRRNVQDGLEIEEFPCTACLPETTETDIAYDIFQVELSLLSKLNSFSMVELGYYFSPYRVSTEPFFSREFLQQIPGSTARYFIGNTLTAAYFLQAETYHIHSDVAPIGLKGHVRYNYEPSSLLDSYDITDGTLVPIYQDFKNHSLEFDARLGLKPFGQFLSIRSRFFSYASSPDDSFFLDYIGGFPGMRSYPFFSLGGTTTAFTQLSYYMPLITGIERQWGRLTPQKIFLRMFAEAGNGWGGDLDLGNNLKTGVGAELRFSLNSYYLFPTRFFISGAYGFNRFDLDFPSEFITNDGSTQVSYGGEILINFGLLFDFDF